MLNWETTAALPWRQRNAEIEATIRKCLGDCTGTFSTLELAKRISRGGNVDKLSQIMTRIAPYLPAFATHDGEEIKRYGRIWRRWRWHGQAALTPVEREFPQAFKQEER